ncbi:hypothetical protein BK809_0000289 [Diplodia seriata]|uniref:Kelch repeat protein n=1 Tax=Diplodia seriata TaxID=420778 RepID=A0A1S8BCE1_9PEZI|nr:hypothetical protein BK809_0000289 [Diplodia seriata]
MRTTIGASAADGSKAYSLGGVVYNWTTEKVKTIDQHNAPGLLIFDFANQTLTNSTDDGGYFASIWNGPDQTLSLAGGMVFAPPFGTQGAFIVIGGQSNNSGEVKHYWDNITVLDPSTGSWYSQEATGAVPSTDDRVNCFVGAQDDELETFDIFVYGGFKDIPGGDTYYVLSLPSFRWFASDVVSMPRRRSMTCTATSNGQMIMVGGLDPDQPSTINDPQNWQASNDPWTQGIGVFDMTKLQYKNKYDASAVAYASPDVVQRYYQSNTLVIFAIFECLLLILTAAVKPRITAKS